MGLQIPFHAVQVLGDRGRVQLGVWAPALPLLRGGLGTWPHHAKNLVLSFPLAKPVWEGVPGWRLL